MKTVDSSRQQTAPPLRYNGHRKYHTPKPYVKTAGYDTGAGSSRSSRPPSNPFEDSYASSVENDSYQPSNTVSSGSSFTQMNVDTPDTGFISTTQENSFFKDRGPPGKKIRTPVTSVGHSRIPRRGKERRSEESTTASSNHEMPEPVQPPLAATGPSPQISPLAETTTTPEVAIKQASEAQRVIVKAQKRGKRNIVIQKYMVTAGLIGLKYVSSPATWTRSTSKLMY